MKSNKQQKRGRNQTIIIGALTRLTHMGVLLLAGTAAGATWVVDDDGGADYTSIQAAVDAAAAGDVTRGASGTHHENVGNQLMLIRGAGSI